MVGAGVVEAFAAPLVAGARAARLVYQPTLQGEAHLHYVNARAGVDSWGRVALQVPIEQSPQGSPWKEAQEVDAAALVLEDEPRSGAGFGELAPAARRPKSMARYAKMLVTHLYRTRPLVLYKSAKPKLISEPGESEGAFRARLRDKTREQRDLAVAKLRGRYTPKLARLEDRIARARAKVEREQEQYDSRKRQTMISVGSTILGALFGRRSGAVGRATTAARGAERAARERGDVRRAEDSLEDLQQDLVGLESELRDALSALEAPVDPASLELAELLIRPRKTEMDVERCALVWMPFWVSENGTRLPGVPTA